MLLYIHDMYVGEIPHGGEVAAPEYWTAQLSQWVTEHDKLRARLIKKGQGEGTGTDIARHTVTLAGSAPASIPRITGVTIVNAGGSALTTVSEGEVMTVKHDQGADGLHYSWKIYNASVTAWNNFPNNTQASLTVPGDFIPGSRLCVLVQPHEEKGPLALSQIVTVKSK